MSDDQRRPEPTVRRYLLCTRNTIWRSKRKRRKRRQGDFAKEQITVRESAYCHRDDPIVVAEKGDDCSPLG